MRSATFGQWLVVVLLLAAAGYGFLSGMKESTIQPMASLRLADHAPTDPAPRCTNESSPQRHVFYLKTHKTGSTTVYSVLAEFCRSRELLPLMPRGVHINLYSKFHPGQVTLHPGVSQYDMLFNHMVFHPSVLKYFPAYTFRFTTIRDPLRHFISTFRFFSQYKDQEYLYNLPGPDPMLNLLTDPRKYEVKGLRSLTNNRQSVDLGYDLRYSRNDTGYQQTFIKQVEKYFNVVLISDYFDESLVLLKRLLRWSTQDILYFQKLKSGKKDEAIDPKIKELHRHHSVADRTLYSHFLKKFKEIISKQENIHGEVKEFQFVLQKVHKFCDESPAEVRQLVIPPGRWTDGVAILKSKCKWLKMDEVSFTAHLKKQQKELVGG